MVEGITHQTKFGL